MSEFGSKAEEQFFSDWGVIPVHGLPLKHNKSSLACGQIIQFKDQNKETFNAMGDGWHKPSLTVVEFKCGKLNKLKTQVDCKVASQQYRGRNKWLRIQGCSWSNSAYKHLIVQETLKEQGVNYLVVFQMNSNVSKQHQNWLDDIGLQWCFEEHFEFYCENTAKSADWNKVVNDDTE